MTLRNKLLVLAWAALLVLAWAAFVVSLLLPSLKTSGGFMPLGEFIWGWACFIGSFMALFDLLRGRLRDVYVALLGLCNLLMLLSPVIIFLNRRGLFIQRAVFVAAAVLVCVARFLPLEPGSDYGFLVGYYVWCLSFVLLAVAANVRVVERS